MNDTQVTPDEPDAPTPSVRGTIAAPPTPPESLFDVVRTAQTYRGSAILHARAHSMATQKFDRRNKYLGVPAAIIAAVVGSSIFASLSSNEKNVYLMVITGALSILAAVLSALQTFLKYSELAQSHKTAKDGYESLVRRIDQFKLRAAGRLSMPRADALKALQGLSDQLDELGKSSPIISMQLTRAASSEAAEFNGLAGIASNLKIGLYAPRLPLDLKLPLGLFRKNWIP